MLAFIDESGDAGLALERGSSPFLTIAIVLFASGDDAASCQQAIEGLRAELHMRPTSEFRFRSDSHDRRVAFLRAVNRQRFRLFAFSLDKARPEAQSIASTPTELYRGVCRMAFEATQADLMETRVVIDGSAERLFQRELSAYLRRELQSTATRTVRSVAVKRSQSDPLLQLADYAAGIANRLCTAKRGSVEYYALIARHVASRVVWPQG